MMALVYKQHEEVACALVLWLLFCACGMKVIPFRLVYYYYNIALSFVITCNHGRSTEDVENWNTKQYRYTGRHHALVTTVMKELKF